KAQVAYWKRGSAMFEDLEPRVFAAVGAAAICLFAGTIGSLPGVWRAAPGPERRHVATWSAVFAPSIVAFSVGVCLLPRVLYWLLPLPMITMVIGVNKANEHVVRRGL